MAEPVSPHAVLLLAVVSGTVAQLNGTAFYPGRKAGD